MDERLGPLGLTARQWLLLAVISRGFPAGSPSLTEAADRYGTSRQNVKQIAIGLQRRGWLRIEPDPVDGRTTRLVLTDKIAVFASPELQEQGDEFLHTVFAGMPESELTRMREFALGLLAHLDPTTDHLAGGAT